MINYIWFLLIGIGIVLGILTGRGQEVSQACIESAKDAGLLCINLIGAYALWLGVLNVAKKSGLVEKIAGKMRRVIAFLFPGVPEKSEASGYITLNIVANMFGMGNAATPFGLKAMKELQHINKDKKTASKAMCMLLVINASSVQIIPLSIIALRSAAGSANPSEIVITALLATTVTTIVGITAAKIMERRQKG